jgi:hypothetical protein
VPSSNFHIRNGRGRVRNSIFATKNFQSKSRASTKSNRTRNTLLQMDNQHNLPANADTYYTPLKLLLLSYTSGKPSTTSTNGP